MTYPKVDRSHIVPQTYLRNFAINDQLAMRLVGESGSKTVNVRDAAVRRAFYRRQRPDGTDIDDIEWSLSHIESAVTTLLRGLHPAWPLDLEKKASLAEFVAVQILRGPRWQEWHSEFVPSAIAEQRADGLPGLDGVAEVVAGDNILSKFEKKIREPTYRYTRMLSLVPKVASILASMGWTLLTFRRPQLVTSDHPVVVWPLRCSAAKPRHLGFAAGILETLEIRIPISPTLALLMTWREEDASDPVGGKVHHERALNAFTVAHAQRQWFHRPGVSPPLGTGRFAPIGPEVHPGYTAIAAENSPLRAEVARRMQPRLGKDFDKGIEVVRVTRRPRLPR